MKRRRPRPPFFPYTTLFRSDQFLITPVGRVEDAARARALGDEIRTVIAGYHWFTDWGRDTMISLEGLTLTTGRKKDRKSTRLNSSHVSTSYAVFCLKKKTTA